MWSLDAFSINSEFMNQDACFGHIGDLLSGFFGFYVCVLGLKGMGVGGMRGFL